jgi:hypothetical protein
MKTSTFFLISAVFYFFILETICRLNYGKSFFHVALVVSREQKAIPLFLIWAISALTAFGLVSIFYNNLRWQLTGHPECCVNLGSKLNMGFYVYRSDDHAKTEVFVPYQNYLSESLGTSLKNVYQKQFYLSSKDQNELVPGFEVSVLRTILNALATGLLSLLSISIVCKFFLQSFERSLGRTHYDMSHKTLWLAGAYFAAYFFFLAGGILAARRFNAKQKQFKALCTGNVRTLPTSVRAGEIIYGKVIATGSHHYGTDNQRWQYKMFCIRFDARSGFEIPVYVNWEARKIYKEDIATAIGNSRKERVDEQRANELIFQHLEKALVSAQYTPFELTDDLELAPQLN